jgi:hypothetical protein
MADDQSEWVVYHPPKSVAFGHVTSIRDPRRAWPRVQSFLSDYVDLEATPSSAPTLRFDLSLASLDPAIATARFEEAIRRFGDPSQGGGRSEMANWVISPSLFDSAVDFALGDEAFPEVAFGPTSFSFYRRFYWREAQSGLSPASERDPRPSLSRIGVTIGGRRIFLQPLLVFTEPWTSNAVQTFLDRLEPQLPFRFRNQYFKRVLAPVGKGRRGRVLNLPADWRRTGSV